MSTDKPTLDPVTIVFNNGPYASLRQLIENHDEAVLHNLPGKSDLENQIAATIQNIIGSKVTEAELNDILEVGASYPNNAMNVAAFGAVNSMIDKQMARASEFLGSALLGEDILDK